MTTTRPYKVSLRSRANRELRKLDRQILARISAAKFDPDWKSTAEFFQEDQMIVFTNILKKSTTSGNQPRWNRLKLVDEAKQVGFEGHLHGAYYLPNTFIHNSAAELLFALEADENGRLTPKDFNNPDERRMADLALQQALLFLLEILRLEIEHYGWRDSAPMFQKFFSAYDTYLKSYATK